MKIDKQYALVLMSVSYSKKTQKLKLGTPYASVNSNCAQLPPGLTPGH